MANLHTVAAQCDFSSEVSTSHLVNYLRENLDRNSPRLGDADLTLYGKVIYEFFSHFSSVPSRFQPNVITVCQWWFERFNSDIPSPSRELAELEFRLRHEIYTITADANYLVAPDRRR